MPLRTVDSNHYKFRNTQFIRWLFKADYNVMVILNFVLLIFFSLYCCFEVVGVFLETFEKGANIMTCHYKCLAIISKYIFQNKAFTQSYPDYSVIWKKMPVFSWIFFKKYCNLAITTVAS